MSRKSFLGFVFLLLLLAAPTSLHAQAFIEHLMPAAVAPGQTTRVTVVGTHLDETTSLWTTLPQGSCSISKVNGSNSKERVQFDIKLNHPVATGLYGVRVATRDGLSNAHLIAVDDLPTTMERELRGPSNNDADEAQLLKVPTAVVGICDKEDIDHFAIEVEAGERLTLEVVGNRLGKGFDPVVTIYDAKGKELRSRDNDQGLFFDCRFGYTFKSKGRYTIAIHDARYHGSPHWSYLFRVGRFPEARVAMPSSIRSGAESLVHFPQLGKLSEPITLPKGLRDKERVFVSLRRRNDHGSAWIPFTSSKLPNTIEQEPNQQNEQANVVTVPGDVHGIVNKSNDVDVFALDLKKGQRLRIRAETRAIGSPADLELSFWGPDGKRIKAVDDAGFEDAFFDISAKVDGRHYLKTADVVGNGGRAYVYRVEVRNREPAVEIESEIGRIAIPQGSWQPLPLKLGRIDYAGLLRVELRGVPDGIRLRENIIQGNLSAWNGAIEVKDTVPPGVYSLQVFAHAYEDKSEFITCATTRPLIDRLPTGRGPHGEPFELREDQRRLPPSLTDRIALVVLPAAPFDFDLTKAEVILPRYVHQDFSLAVRRKPGFEQEITFEARGGQLEYNRLQKPSINATIPPSKTAQHSLVKGMLVSGVNTLVQTQRVTVTATSKLPNGRTINLTRTFDLNVKPAFKPFPETDVLTIAPGKIGKVKLHAGRLAPYQGVVRLLPGKVEGLSFAEELEISPGNDSIEFAIKVAPGTKPGKYSISIGTTAKIDKFYEQTPATKIEVEVK